jgi:beta-phosphoglucomutase-like phosphatase (HAD superfamily)
VTAGPPGNGGVIFDLDGAPLDTNYLHVAAWWEAFRERPRHPLRRHSPL